jgi:DNA-binding MarR family transcriptional regulator
MTSEPVTTNDDARHMRETLVHELRMAMDHLTWVALGQQARILKPYGLTGPQVLALKVLWNHAEPLDMVHLAEATTLPPSTLTSVVDRFERDGLAVRQQHPTDRRRVMVSITADGRALLEKLDRQGEDLAMTMLEGVSDGDVRVTRDVIRQLADALERIDFDTIAETPSRPDA